MNIIWDKVGNVGNNKFDLMNLILEFDFLKTWTLLSTFDSECYS